jgi:hypothetical protein
VENNHERPGNTILLVVNFWLVGWLAGWLDGLSSVPESVGGPHFSNTRDKGRAEQAKNKPNQPVLTLWFFTIYRMFTRTSPSLILNIIILL